MSESPEGIHNLIKQMEQRELTRDEAIFLVGRLKESESQCLSLCVYQGESLLMIATRTLNEHVVRVLMEHKVSLGEKDENGVTALMKLLMNNQGHKTEAKVKKVFDMLLQDVDLDVDAECFWDRWAAYKTPETLQVSKHHDSGLIYSALSLAADFEDIELFCKLKARSNLSKQKKAIIHIVDACVIRRHLHPFLLAIVKEVPSEQQEAVKKRLSRGLEGESLWDSSFIHEALHCLEVLAEQRVLTQWIKSPMEFKTYKIESGTVDLAPRVARSL